MVKRLAFTLIELIFAILIISIAVLSLPMMTQVTSEGVRGNIVQEAIFGASAELNQVVSFKWDENSTDAVSSTSKVIWTSALDCNQTTKQRAGHIAQEKHRRCSDNNFTMMQPSAIGSDSGDLDDLDDLDGNTTLIFVSNAGGAVTDLVSYKNNYNRTIDVDYVDFGDLTLPAAVRTTAASRDMKEIQVTVTDITTDEVITVLKTYSANIGEIDFYTREY